MGTKKMQKNGKDKGAAPDSPAMGTRSRSRAKDSPANGTSRKQREKIVMLWETGPKKCLVTFSEHWRDSTFSVEKEPDLL